MKKEYGGLGVSNLRELNICLLGSWIRRYVVGKDNIWKMLIDFKYNTCNPNIFICKDSGASNFWKGVLWVVKVLNMSYRWKVGNDAKIMFWEDVCVCSTSLAIQFWEIYSIVNEQNKSIAKIWDGVHKYNFRWCVDSRLFKM
jgi:hypothetical protein